MEGGTYDVRPYLQAIQMIRDKSDGKQVTYTSLDIQCISAKYSNTKTPIYKIVIDNTPIARNNSLTVVYKCINCTTCQEITLNLYTRKINKQSIYCSLCKNENESKREQQAMFMKENCSTIMRGEYQTKKQQKKGISLSEHLALSAHDWSVDDAEFKEAYDHAHLTVEEFNNVKSKIKGINNKKIIDLGQWEYWFNYRVFNQSRYTPMLVNLSENIVEKPLYITFDCENCGIEHTHRDLEVVKNKIKVLCRDCTLTNKSFRLRKMEMTDGNSIMWQSVPEKRFIMWCQKHNITIRNGPRLKYTFGDTQHEYRVDFELPDLKMLIEIKDNHCWHLRQVESGKHAAKEAAAKIWCAENNYEYNIVFPKTNATIRNYIINKSCKI